MKERYIEDIILRYSERGMDILRNYLPDQYCKEAAEAICKLKKGTIILTTGFYVAGFAETDGPPGAYFLAKALEKIGFQVVIITDKYCNNFFRDCTIEYLDIISDKKSYLKILKKYNPRALISIERCGRNILGNYENMRGEDILPYTAKIDQMFDLADRKCVMTIGIGDGGNEIGMGNFAKVIESELSLNPCRVKVDYPIIATVSNWGAYGLISYIGNICGVILLPEYKEVEHFFDEIVAIGSIDGVTKQHSKSVDGFNLDVDKEIFEALKSTCLNSLL